MKKTVRFFSHFATPIISILYGLYKYFTASNKTDSELIIITLCTLVVIPLLSVMINFWILRFNLESATDSLKNSIEHIGEDNKAFIQQVSVLISDTISRSSNYFTVLSHKHKEKITSFIPGIIEDFNLKFKELSNGHLY